MGERAPVQQLAVVGLLSNRIAKRIARVPRRAAVEMLANRRNRDIDGGGMFGRY
jgi:hypothetical protein